jgi:hypothetical protein
VRALDFAPGAAAGAGLVAAGAVLEDEAFDAEGLAGFEEVGGVAGVERGDHDRRAGDLELLEQAPATCLGDLGAAGPLDPEDVEGGEGDVSGDRPPAGEGGGDGVEVAGPAGGGDQFAVEADVESELGERGELGT